MPAPTALHRAPTPIADVNEQRVFDRQATTSIDDQLAIVTDFSHSQPHDRQDEQHKQPSLDALLDTTSQDVSPTVMDLDNDDDEVAAAASNPLFRPEVASASTFRAEERKIRIPPHRMTPLKVAWPEIYPPLVEHLHLQVRMNLAKKCVELRTCPPRSIAAPTASTAGNNTSTSTSTTSPSTTPSSTSSDSASALQKGADFIHAFTLGFALADAIALLRLDDLYIQTFSIKDVKAVLHGEHLSRAIGRIAGKDGKTKFAIENASRTRIVLADQKVHILGGFKNIAVAREAVVSLVLGSPPGKVYGNLRSVAGRMKERF